jgi:hypothetical protein
MCHGYNSPECLFQCQVDDSLPLPGHFRHIRQDISNINRGDRRAIYISDDIGSNACMHATYIALTDENFFAWQKVAYSV